MGEIVSFAAVATTVGIGCWMISAPVSIKGVRLWQGRFMRETPVIKVIAVGIGRWRRSRACSEHETDKVRVINTVNV